MTAFPLDPVDLTRRLIRSPSVTPEAGAALDLIADDLTRAGFACTRVDRNGTPNLFARWGAKGHPKTFGFNGHLDVVPVGDAAAWTRDPFGAETSDGWIYGRGATDMKSGVAAFVAAAVAVAAAEPEGAIVLTLTGDEEGPATDGTTAILDWMDEQGERMSVCLVGEPTCPETLGEMMKIGRRGSISAFFTATGTQGHVAYPHRAANPVPALACLIDRLSRARLDDGTAHFDPSTLAATTFDVGNPATNVIPAEARATVNIRFNDRHSAASLTAWLGQEMAKVAAETGIGFDMTTQVSGEAFLTAPGPLTDLVARVVEAETGMRPVASTSGGTSDARFVRAHCPVVEFGLVGHRMHQVDERVAAAEIPRLAAIYAHILTEYFQT